MSDSPGIQRAERVTKIRAKHILEIADLGPADARRAHDKHCRLCTLLDELEKADNYIEDIRHEGVLADEILAGYRHTNDLLQTKLKQAYHHCRERAVFTYDDRGRPLTNRMVSADTIEAIVGDP